MNDSSDTTNLTQLREAGWSIGAMFGNYCVAWRGSDEVVFAWRGGEWHLIANRSAGRLAA
jgi:hypothetical protein